MLNSLLEILSLTRLVRSEKEAGSDFRWFCDKLSLVRPPRVPKTSGSDASWLDSSDRDCTLVLMRSHIHAGHDVSLLFLKLSFVMEDVTI